MENRRNAEEISKAHVQRTYYIVFKYTFFQVPEIILHQIHLMDLTTYQIYEQKSVDVYNTYLFS